MEKDASVKVSVLVCGDVLGRFTSLFYRISKLLKRDKSFEALYCVGSFFGEDNSEWELVRSGNVKVPIPCYILGACKPEHTKFFPDPNGGELSSNIIYLGKKGILSTATGMKIAYISGIEGGREPHNFTAKDIVELQDNFQSAGLRGVDFLLTSPWPEYVSKGVLMPQRLEKNHCSNFLSYLATTIKPCYHFAGLQGIYMERLPYRNSKVFSDKASHFTRFVGLADVPNTSGEQFLYGLSHCPLLYVSEKDLLDQQKEISTECPYRHLAISHKRTFAEEHHEVKKKQKCKTNFQECWFCLSLSVEKHLIIMTGQFCYVSLPKGWLVPDHFLIISNAHHSSTATLTEDEMNELHDFKRIVKRYLYSKGRDVVFFERNYKSPHLQLQAVGIPRVLNPSIEDTFLHAASQNNITLEEIPPDAVMKQVVGSKKPFFYLELHCGNSRVKKYIHLIEQEFPLLFPRQVLASESVLNVPHRVNWRECAPSRYDDTVFCDNLRKLFERL